ncbi:MAG: hypothetical protein E6I20_03985 [Chloroflexi bacterium]|nr:MAG: hypothetical protein E6I20_03985 [Chloroflexota bacterium]
MSSGGRRRLPTWSARNGGEARAVISARRVYRARPMIPLASERRGGSRQGAEVMKRRQLIQRAAALGGAAAVAPLIAACGPAATAPSASPAASAAATATAKPIRTLKVGYIPLTDFLGMYAAIEQGYIADEGLKLELQAMSGGAAIIPAITGGSLDFGISNYVSTILSNAQGLKIKVFSDSAYDSKDHSPFSVVVKKGSPVKAAKDLNGKKIAVNTRNNIVHVGVMEWMEQKGGDPKTAQFVELPFPQMPAALTQGQVDAIAPTEPFVTVSTSQDGQILANYFAEIRDNVAIAGFISTEDWINKNRDVAQAFHRANTKGMDFVAKNEKTARDYVVKYANLDPALAGKVNLSALRSTPLLDSVQFWVDMSKKWGLLDKSSTLKAEDLFVKF